MKKNKPFGELFYSSLKKTLLIMRIAVILMILGILQARANDAYSQKTMLSLNFSETPLVKVLDKIEDESEFFFLYNEKLLDTERKVSIDAKDQLVSVILDNLFAGTAVRYTIIDRKIILAPDYLTSEPQQNKITGTVTGKDGTPLPGVNVVVTGTTQGTLTDIDGKYNINVPQGSKSLTFSFVGMEPQEITIGTLTKIDVTLVESAIGLEEVVVVGYGTQRKVSITGSVAAVALDSKITSRSLSTVSSGLSGLVPGLRVQQNTGMAGRSGAVLQIRGIGTVNNASPLIVVDGMPDVDINTMDINDIKTISVLKDASSASVYGSRGANGVILITTKSGTKDAKAAFNYTGTYSLSQPTNFYEQFADYPRGLTMHIRSSNAGGGNSSYRQGTIEEWMAKGMVDPFHYPNTDMWDLIMHNFGKIQTHNLSASGGTDKMNFYISAGINDELGLVLNTDFTRYNTRVNVEYMITDKIKVGTRIDGVWSKQTYTMAAGLNQFSGDLTYNIAYAPSGIVPIDPVSGKYGAPMAYGESQWATNLWMLVDGYSRNKRERQELNGSIYSEWEPIKGLQVRGDVSIRYYNQFLLSYQVPTIEWNFQTDQPGYQWYYSTAGVNNSIRQGYKTLAQAKINYTRELFPGHEFLAMVAFAEEYWFNRSMSASRQDAIYLPVLLEIDASLPTHQFSGGSSDGEGLRSVIGRINYNINDKYLFEANARYDGSSRFFPGHQYGFFPSVAVGWRFSNEPFFQGLTNIIPSGKIRFSYGQLGNNSGVGLYEQRAVFALTSYSLNSKVAKGFSNTSMINEDFSWEKTTVANIGLDLSFLDNHLTSEIDLYNKLTTGMIRPSSLSTFLSGYTAPRVNIGEMQNQGIEANITWRSNFGKFNYGANLNATFNANRLLQWNEYLTKGSTFLDLPYNFVYAQVSNGIAQSWEDIANAPFHGQNYAPGDILYQDLNGDGQISSEDRKAFPKYNIYNPRAFYGLNLFSEWKEFDLSILFQAATGRRDFWLEPYNTVTPGGDRNTWLTCVVGQTWALDNRTASLPRLTTGSGGNNRANSTFWLDNCDYLRLKNIQFGYNIPKKYIRTIGITNCRLYFTSENLITFTKWRGIDPEKSSQTELADDLFPLLKSYSFGLNLSF